MNELAIKMRDTTVEIKGEIILDIPELSVYKNERIAIIGNNGQGKTTLLNLIAGKLNANYTIERHIDFKYFEQIEKSIKDHEIFDFKLAAEFNIPENNKSQLSGGEKQKLRLISSLSDYKEGLLLDEPTTHLDNKGIKKLVDELNFYYGTLIVVSHNRDFINQIADKIWEISDGKITEYIGNYDDYKVQKNLHIQTQMNNFEKYHKQKRQLEHSLAEKRKQAENHSKNVNKSKKLQIKPSRLVNTKQKDTVQKNLHKSAKAVESRIKKLNFVESSKVEKLIVFPAITKLELNNKFPIRGDHIVIKRGNTTLLNNVNFQFPLGKKVALTGPNGSGKTTLLNYINENNLGVTISQKAKINMYGQMDYKLIEDVSLLEYVQKQSEFEQQFIISILMKLGFSIIDLKKKVNVLSGGEATRLVLALTFLKPSNILLLDEPTNFIDLNTILALENLIKVYPGTVIFTSHDRFFIEKVATSHYEIKNKKLIQLF